MSVSFIDMENMHRAVAAVVLFTAMCGNVVGSRLEELQKEASLQESLVVLRGEKNEQVGGADPDEHLRPRSCCLRYSVRSARIGSNVAALRAGTSVATRAAAANTTVVISKISGA